MVLNKVVLFIFLVFLLGMGIWYYSLFWVMFFVWIGWFRVMGFFIRF